MLESYLKDLEELVNVDCGSFNAAGVTFCAEVMKRHFESIGFTAELVKFTDEYGCGLFATNKPGAERYDILMNAHLDTVFPDGTAAARP
ncbi:MAG: M20 family peptidase, partial [Duodenibacillus sp.]|nr:M20 family peptidase [Duodenibacillus sp.]